MNEIQDADRNLIYQMADHFRSIYSLTETLDYASFVKDERNVKEVAELVAKAGQAASAISFEFKEHFNSISWDSLMDLEAATADEEGPSAEITWGMVKEDLPYLAATIDQVIDFMDNPQEGSDDIQGISPDDQA
jgi:uncharacterized protein with HEPN domain